MRLACEARALHIPREIPSLPRTLDSSFSLKDSSAYNIPYCSIIGLPISILTLYNYIV
jgi:hypothetical protein